MLELAEEECQGTGPASNSFCVKVSGWCEGGRHVSFVTRREANEETMCGSRFTGANCGGVNGIEEQWLQFEWNVLGTGLSHGNGAIINE